MTLQKIVGLGLLLSALEPLLSPTFDDPDVRDFLIFTTMYGGALFFTALPLVLHQMTQRPIWKLIFWVLSARFLIRMLLTAIDGFLPSESAALEVLSGALAILGLFIWAVAALTIVIRPVMTHRRLSRVAGLLLLLSVLATPLFAFDISGIDRDLVHFARTGAEGLRLMSAVLFSALLLGAPTSGPRTDGAEKGGVLLQIGAWGYLFAAFGALFGYQHRAQVLGAALVLIGSTAVLLGLIGRYRQGKRRIDLIALALGVTSGLSMWMIEARVWPRALPRGSVAVPLFGFALALLISTFFARRFGGKRAAIGAVIVGLLTPILTPISLAVREHDIAGALMLGGFFIWAMLTAIRELAAADQIDRATGKIE